MTGAGADFTRRTVADIMQHVVVTVTPDTPLAEVARVLWDEQISGVPVVDDAGRPIGFVSASDLVRFRAFGPGAAAPAGEERSGLAARDIAPPERIDQRRRSARRAATARDVMTAATLAVRSTATVPQLARFLVRAGVHHALVIEAGRLRGIVSAFDVVGEVAQHAAAGEPTERFRALTAGDTEC